MEQFISGTIAGAAGIVVGQPLDTVKVRLQTSMGLYKGPFDCFRQIARNEGWAAFFKGMASPIAASAPINAVLFVVHFQSYSLLERGSAADWAPLTRHFAAGVMSGLSQVPIAAPSELVKIRLQIQHDSGIHRYSGSWSCVSDIVKCEGIRGLYRGTLLTALRDAPAFGIYFWSYAYFKDMFVRRREAEYLASHHRANNLTALSIDAPLPRIEASLPELTFAGGMAGLLSFMFLQPIDVMKSVAQSVERDSHTTFRGLLTQYYRAEGPRFLFRGLLPTCVRAFPVSAVIFVVQEHIVKLLSLTRTQ